MLKITLNDIVHNTLYDFLLRCSKTEATYLPYFNIAPGVIIQVARRAGTLFVYFKFGKPICVYLNTITAPLDINHDLRQWRLFMELILHFEKTKSTDGIQKIIDRSRGY